MVCARGKFTCHPIETPYLSDKNPKLRSFIEAILTYQTGNLVRKKQDTNNKKHSSKMHRYALT